MRASDTARGKIPMRKVYVKMHSSSSGPGSLRPGVVVWALSCLLFVCLGCGHGAGRDEASGGPGVSFPTTTPTVPFTCNPLAESCLAPFPSNLLTAADPHTPTGVRLALSDEAFQRTFSPVILAKGAELFRAGNFHDADGFSPLGLIVIPLAGPVDPACLPSTEESVGAASPFFLVDMASGARIPVDVRLDAGALEEDPPQYILVATTRDRVPFGSTLLVVLTRGLRGPDGSPLDPFPVYRDLQSREPLADPDLRAVQTLYRPLFAYMKRALGIDPEETVLAFDFTVRSEPSLTRIPMAMREAVLRRAGLHPPAFEVERVASGGIYGRGAVQVTGRYAAPDFRSADGTLNLGPDGLPVSGADDAIEVLLLVPPAAAEGSVPVVVFGHGFLAMKETLILLSRPLIEAGFAIVGIDVAAHGSRRFRDGYIGGYLNLDDLFRMRDAILQTVPDQIQLCRLIETGLAGLDVVPYRSGNDFGDGAADLDTSRVLFVSQSLGSMIGTTFLAYEPSVQAAVLNVPGGGLMNVFRNATSGLVRVFASGFLPPEASPLELSLLMALLQLPFDLMDPLNYAHRVLEEPLPGRGPVQILLQQSIGDGLVPHDATASLARGLGIPLVEPSLEGIPDLERVTAPALGQGLFQFRVSPDPLLAHGLLLMDGRAHRQMVEFFRSFVETGTARIVDPAS